MFDVIEAIWEAIVAFAEWIFGLVKAVFTAVWDMGVDLVAYVLDQILGFVVGLLNAINVAAFDSSLGAWGSLPSEVINVLGLIGLADCFAIIAAAIGIRLILQLIPFVRLGS